MKHFRMFLFLSFIVTLVHSIPKPSKNLSGQMHYVDGQHNQDYDHEVFLGKDAKTFDQLTPEESKERLSAILTKIDQNNDNLVSREELKFWIKYTQQRYITDDVQRQWKTFNPQNKEALSWNEYKTMVYGFAEGVHPVGMENNIGTSYEQMLRRDQRRWDNADVNGDKALDKDEFMSFLHPENAAHMRDIVVLETMEDIDKDKDGKVSLSEYIGDMYTGSDDEDEPDWVKNEKQQFVQYRDKNKDGYMDSDEVKQWIIPPEFDHADAEAKHLINESDLNNDGLLSKEEVLDKYDLFVGSQATDFGEALTRHDEF